MEHEAGCVLLVDDDETTNILHKAWLKVHKVPYQVVSAQNGREALEYLNTVHPDWGSDGFMSPLVILLDLNMPVMDGWEFLEAFMGVRDRFGSCRLYVLTSSPNPDDEKRAKAFPCVTGYLLKPLSREAMSGLML